MTQCPVSLKTTIDTSDATSLTCCRDKFPFDFSPAITSNGIPSFVCESCAKSRHLRWLTLQWFMGAISFSRYPGWWFGVSSRSTSHSTMYRRPFRVFLVAIIVPILRSATSRGVLTHILSPGLSFSIVSPPEVRYSASENILLGIDLVYNILYTGSHSQTPIVPSTVFSMSIDTSSHVTA